MGDNHSLKFSLQFYHHVEDLGDCRHVNDSRMFGLDPAMPTVIGELPGLCLALIAFLLNGLSLIIFCVDEWGGIRFRRSSALSNSAADKTMRFNMSSAEASRSTTVIVAKKTGGAGGSKSSVTLSLLLLCACECTYLFGKIVFRTSLFVVPLTVSANITSIEELNYMKQKIQVLPVFQNALFFISDVGLMCRNWCVCLITIARAEVVLWPLGSRRWQRFLRTRRWFFTSFLVVLLIAMTLAYVKHADFIGLMCFDYELKRFGLWMHEFLMSQDQFASFELFGYHLIQSCLVWCLIALFTLVIIVRLKPWKQDVEKLFSSLKQAPPSQNSANQSLCHQSISAQADVMQRRQRSQIRATRVVVVIVVMFLVLEFASFVSVVVQFSGLLDPHGATMRMLESVANTMVSADSIGNFLVFILTLKQFRIMCLHLLCCRCGQGITSPGTTQPNNTNGQTTSTSSGQNYVSNQTAVTERTHIELE